MLHTDYGNIIFGSQGRGLWFQPQGQLHPDSVINFYNNTFFDNGLDSSSPEVQFYETYTDVEVNFINNILYNVERGSSQGLSIDNSFGGTLNHSHNLYYHTNPDKTVVYNKGASYTLSQVTGFEATAQAADPQFVGTALLPATVTSTTGADPDGLSVQAGSPAIGGGVDLGSTYAQDIDLNARSGAWTIGAYETAGVELPPDTNPPTASITAPLDGAAVSGIAATLSANASDDTGVAGVQFKLDGVNLGSEDTTSPYTISWDTTGTSDGSHSLTAVARDAAGNTATSASITVTVTNAPPPVDIPAPPSGLRIIQ
jgi:hypothetical protein